jgi:hypothetical protein
VKTKSILQVVILAVAILAAVGQQAPAAVIGYYNITLAPGWNLLANQLLQANSNANFVLQGSPVDGSLLYRFNPATQSYYDAGTYISGVGWYPRSGNTNDSVLNLPLGEGFFIWTPQSWVVTFVGEVAQGSLTNPIPANYSLKASMVPQAGDVNSLGFPKAPNDQVWRWGNGQSITYTNYTFDEFDLVWYPTVPAVRVGEGFFSFKLAATNWVRNFTVQSVTGPPIEAKTALATTLTAAGPSISLSSQGTNVVLEVPGPVIAPYNVQFSRDGVSWETIATGQTATRWQEPSRGSQGFYQLANP